MFRNNLQALLRLHREGERWELVVIDYNSTDVNMSKFLKRQFQKLEKSGFSYKVVSMDEIAFNRGQACNKGVHECSYANIFILDADMLLTDRKVLIQANHHLSKGKVYFPVCIDYLNPTHTQQRKRICGAGNVCIHIDTYKKLGLKWPEYTKWGKEDVNFYNQCYQYGICERSVINTFFHQWHPTAKKWKNRFFADS